MARNNDPNRICAIGKAHRPNRRGPADLLGKLAHRRPSCRSEFRAAHATLHAERACHQFRPAKRRWPRVLLRNSFPSHRSDYSDVRRFKPEPLLAIVEAEEPAHPGFMVGPIRGTKISLSVHSRQASRRWACPADPRTTAIHQSCALPVLGLRAVGGPQVLRSIGAPRPPGFGPFKRLSGLDRIPIDNGSPAKQADVRCRKGIRLAKRAQRDILCSPFADSWDRAQSDDRFFDGPKRAKEVRVSHRSFR